MKESAFNLLKSWCDKIIKYQLTSIVDKNLYAIYCKFRKR